MAYPQPPEIAALPNLVKSIGLLDGVHDRFTSAWRRLHDTRSTIAAQWLGVAGPTAVRSVDGFCKGIDVVEKAVLDLGGPLGRYRAVLVKARDDLNDLNRRRKTIDDEYAAQTDETLPGTNDRVLLDSGYNGAVGRMDGEYDGIKEAIKKGARTANDELKGIAGRVTRHYDRTGKVVDGIGRILAPDTIDGGDHGVTDPRYASPTYVGDAEEGDRGDRVQTLQALLAARGWSVTIDGRFGPETRAKLRAFQEEKGIKPPTGRLDQATWDALWKKKITW